MKKRLFGPLVFTLACSSAPLPASLFVTRLGRLMGMQWTSAAILAAIVFIPTVYLVYREDGRGWRTMVGIASLGSLWMWIEVVIRLPEWLILSIITASSTSLTLLGALLLTHRHILAPVVTILMRRTTLLGSNVTAEFALAPPTLTLRDVRLWQWLIDFANDRFFFGPMSMPIDHVTCGEIIFDLNPLHMLEAQTVPFSVNDFQLFCHRAHEDEWDEEKRLDAYTRWRKGHANWVSSLIEPPPKWSPRLYQWGIDWIFAHIDLLVNGVHIRVEDRLNKLAFGITVGRWHFQCDPPCEDSLGAPRRHFRMKKIKLYMDPTATNRAFPRDGFLCADEGHLAIDFPNIFQCLINHLPMPYNQGKRLKAVGYFSGVTIVLHEEQVQTFLWEMMGSVGRFKYGFWKREMRTKDHLRCRPLTERERERYRDLYGTRRSVARMTRHQLRERARQLDALEDHMSFCEIVHLRRDARQWRFDVPSTDAPVELDDWCLLGHPDDPKREQNRALAAFVREAKLRAWQRYMYLRELEIELGCTKHLQLLFMAKKSSPNDEEGESLYPDRPDYFFPSTAQQHDTDACSESIRRSFAGEPRGSIFIRTGVARLDIRFAKDPRTGHPVGAVMPQRSRGGRLPPELPWLRLHLEGKEIIIVDEPSLRTRHSSSSSGHSTFAHIYQPSDTADWEFREYYQAEGHLNWWNDGEKHFTAALRDSDLLLVPSFIIDGVKLIIRTFQRPADLRRFVAPPPPVPPPPTPPCELHDNEMTYGDIIASEGNPLEVAAPPPPSAVAARGGELARNLQLGGLEVQFDLQLERLNLVLIQDPSDSSSNLLMVKCNGTIDLLSSLYHESLGLLFEEFTVYPALATPNRGVATFVPVLGYPITHPTHLEIIAASSLCHVTPGGGNMNSGNFTHPGGILQVTLQRLSFNPTADVSGSFELPSVDCIVGETTQTWVSSLRSATAAGDAVTLEFPFDLPFCTTQNTILDSLPSTIQLVLRDASWLADNLECCRASLSVPREMIQQLTTEQVGDVKSAEDSWRVTKEGQIESHVVHLETNNEPAESIMSLRISLAWHPRFLRVTVHESRNMRPSEVLQGSQLLLELVLDSSASASVGASAGTAGYYRGCVELLEASPCFGVNESLYFRCCDIASPLLHLRALDHGAGTTPEVLALQSLRVPAGSLVSNSDDERQWVSLKLPETTQASSDGETWGEFQLSFQWSFEPPPADAVIATLDTATMATHDVTPSGSVVEEPLPGIPLSRSSSDTSLASASSGHPHNSGTHRDVVCRSLSKHLSESAFKALIAKSIPPEITAPEAHSSNASERNNLPRCPGLVLMHEANIKGDGLCLHLTELDVTVMTGVYKTLREAIASRMSSRNTQASADSDTTDTSTASTTSTAGTASTTGTTSTAGTTSTVDTTDITDTASTTSTSDDIKVTRGQLLKEAFNRFVGQNSSAVPVLPLPQVRELVGELYSQGGEITQSELETEVERCMTIFEQYEGRALSCEEFIYALEITQETPHQGAVESLCGEFASMQVVSNVLGRHRSLAVLLSQLPPFHESTRPTGKDLPIRLFWAHYLANVGVSKSMIPVDPSDPARSIKTVQQKLVRSFRNYRFARTAWGLLVLPALAELPSIGSITVQNRQLYQQMLSPVGVGTPVYVDTRATTKAIRISFMPAFLRRQVLTGIMTGSRDKGANGRGEFLEFQVSKPCCLYLCFDARCRRRPDWVSEAGFRSTSMYIQTNAGITFRVLRAERAKAGRVTLGANEQKRLFQYFLLIGRPVKDVLKEPHNEQSPWTPMGIKVRALEWLLHNDTPAGGVKSLSKTLDDYVRFRGPKTTKLHLSQSEVEGPMETMQAPSVDTLNRFIAVRVKYDTIEAHVMDSKFRDRSRIGLRMSSINLEVEGESAGGSLSTEDVLFTQGSGRMQGTYFNSLVHSMEYFIEPCMGSVFAQSVLGSPIISIGSYCDQHFTVNMSSAFMNEVASITESVNNQRKCHYTLSAVDAQSTAQSRVRFSVNGDTSESTPGPTPLEANTPAVEEQSVHIENLSGVNIRVWLEHYEDPDDPRLGYNGDLYSSNQYVIEDGHTEQVFFFEGVNGLDDQALHIQLDGFQPIQGIRCAASGVQLFPLREPGQQQTDYRRRKMKRERQARLRSRMPFSRRLAHDQRNVVESEQRAAVGVASAVSRASWTSWVDGCDFGLGEYLAIAVELKSHNRRRDSSLDPSFGVITIRCNVKYVNRLKTPVELLLPASHSTSSMKCRPISLTADTIEQFGRSKSSQRQPLLVHGSLPVLQATTVMPDDEVALPCSILRIGELFARQEGDPWPVDPIFLSPESFDLSLPDSERHRSSFLHLTNVTIDPIIDGNTAKLCTATTLADWTIAALPSYTFVNALPCTMEYEIIQPEGGASLETIGGGLGGGVSAGFLSDENPETLFARLDTSPDTGARVVGGQMPRVVCRGVMEMGVEEEIEGASLDRPLHIRMRLIRDGRTMRSWSPPISLSAETHQSRERFNDGESVPIELPQRSSDDSEETPQIRWTKYWRFGDSRRLVFYANYWVINKTSVALWYQSDLVQKQQQSNASTPSTSPTAAQAAQQQRKQQQRQQKELARGESSRKSSDDSYLYSDGQNLRYFGTKTTGGVPVMLDCPLAKLRIMPYSHSSQSTMTNLLYASDIQVNSGHPYRMKTDFGLGDKVYIDSEVVMTQLPEVLAGRQQLVGIQTADADKHVSWEREDFVTFKVSCDADVFLCYDAHASKPAPWLRFAGFRPTSSRVRTTSGIYALYHRYYPKGAIVRLGGAEAKRSVKDTFNYFVLMTTPLHPDQELSIDSIQVNRSMAENAVCRTRACMLPRFSTGDAVYVDRDYVLPDLPSQLRHRNLVALQTAQNDKRSFTSNFMTFTLSRRAYVFVGMDSRAVSPPAWLGQTGFTRMEFDLPGTEGDFHYQVYGKLCLRGLVTLGPNYGLMNGAKRMYIVLCSPQDDEESDGLFVGSPSDSSATEDATPPESEHFWDRASRGELFQVSPPFDVEGRRWSPRFNVDAINTTGEVSTTCAIFGVSLSPLPGLFHRTKVVTIQPRFVVENRLDVPLQILAVIIPTSTQSPDLAGFTQLPSTTADGSSADQTHHGQQQQQQSGMLDRYFYSYASVGAQSAQESDHISCVGVPGGASAILYHFTDLSKQRADRANQSGTSSSKVFGRSDGRRCITLRLSGTPTDIPSSLPIVVDDMGETHVWIRDRDGKKRWLVGVRNSVDRSTVYIVIRDATQAPPHRIENRSSTTTLLYRQIGTKQWAQLAPMRWRSYLWDDPMKQQKLEFAFQPTRGANKVAVAGVYDLDRIAELESLNPVKVHTSRSRATAASTPTGLGTQALVEYMQDSQSGPDTLTVELRASGCTRVLSFGDRRAKKRRGHSGVSQENLSFLQRVYYCLDATISLRGFSLVLIESRVDGSQELACITADSISLRKIPQSDATRFSVHHFQIDDMRGSAKFPVVFQPIDSGFNSLLREDKRSVPFFQMKYERDVSFDNILHFKSFEMVLQQMQVKLDMDYILRLAGLLARLFRHASRTESFSRSSRKYAVAALDYKLSPPTRSASSGLAYFEFLRHSSIIAQMEFMFGTRKFNHEDLEDDEHLGLALFGSGLWSTLAVIGNSVAHVSPTFQFNELIVKHSFGNQLDLARSIFFSLVKQGLAQSYKVVGSMEMLGDPVSLVNNMGTGVYQFFRKTGADLMGESEHTGEGLKDLVQGVVGGTFGSVAKITGAADDLITSMISSPSSRNPAARPAHVGEGLVIGGERVWRGVTDGLTGIVARPFEGARQDGFGGFIVGLGKGVVGVVASPVAGVFGGVSAVSQSVDANLKYWDARPMGRRRDPRKGSGYHTRILALITAEQMLSNIPVEQARRKVRRLANSEGEAELSAREEKWHFKQTKHQEDSEIRAKPRADSDFDPNFSEEEEEIHRSQPQTTSDQFSHAPLASQESLAWMTENIAPQRQPKKTKATPPKRPPMRPAPRP